ncbi:MAG: sel1 repeat family protein [Myxococcales bacterium]|nr:sel1 repeat family protein [Myxococcales bacterium]
MSAGRLAPAVLAALSVALGSACRDAEPMRRTEHTRPAVTSSALAPAPGGSAACAPGLAAPCERACDAGDDRACELLTAMYLRGDGVPRSDAQAAALNRRLCEQGRRYFCPTFAFVLAEGRGMPADRARARELFVATCAADATACSEYGHLYATGTGVARDLELGHLLLDLACRAGEARACDDLRHFTPAPTPPG